MEGGQQEGEQQPTQAAAPADDLLSIDDAAAQARWQQLGEQELQDEIARYRTSLQSLAQDLASAATAPGGQAGHRAGACRISNASTPHLTSICVQPRHLECTRLAAHSVT